MTDEFGAFLLGFIFGFILCIYMSHDIPGNVMTRCQTANLTLESCMLANGVENDK